MSQIGADRRFEKAFKAAKKRFDVEHANYEPWKSEVNNSIGKFVMIDGGVQAYDWVKKRDGVCIDGMGQISGEDVLTVKPTY